MSVRMGLLALLAEGPTHGYQLKTAFEEATGGVWSINVGQVYATLERLQGDDLVEPVVSEGGAASNGRDRRPWRITQAGKVALEAWFDEATVDTVPPREELLIKVLLAFGQSKGEAVAVIDRQRTALYLVMQAAERPASGLDLAADLMAEAISARREADLRWLDRCEARILAAPPEGKPQ